MTSADSNTAVGRHSNCNDDEWALRTDLAAAFRLLNRYGMSDLTNGSVVARLPGESEWFLTHPHGLHFHEIKASDLLKVNSDGDAFEADVTTNFAVCRPAASIFRARPDVNAIIHAHGYGVMGIAALECGLLPICEAAFAFYNDIAYIDADFFFEPEYCAQISQTLGSHKALIYRHHAFATVGATVAEAFFFAYSLNVASELQLKVLASNEKVLVPPPEVCQRHYEAFFGSDWQADGSVEWPGLRRTLDAEEPSYAS
jgi:ribulose-5-phosphate 4-epimerase/fuculose-1-phosphate aldolase